MPTGAVDAFPVDTAISIQFNGWCQLVGESLCYLPVGMPIHSLVARVGDVILRLRDGFLRGVLPTIGVLQLEVGITGQLAVIQGETVMLTDVTIGTNTRGVLKHHTVFAMLLGNDVDHTSDCITTIEGTRCPLHNFYLFNVVGINQRQVVLTAIITMQSPAVYQNQHIRVDGNPYRSRQIQSWQ